MSQRRQAAPAPPHLLRQVLGAIVVPRAEPHQRQLEVDGIGLKIGLKERHKADMSVTFDRACCTFLVAPGALAVADGAAGKQQASVVSAGRVQPGWTRT